MRLNHHVNLTFDDKATKATVNHQDSVDAAPHKPDATNDLPTTTISTGQTTPPHSALLDLGSFKPSACLSPKSPSINKDFTFGSSGSRIPAFLFSKSRSAVTSPHLN